MNLTKYSKEKFFTELNHWHVDSDNMRHLYNYLVHALSPGSFYEALYSNDATGALSRSHPGNNMLNLINLARCIRSCYLWGTAFGSYEIVHAWLRMPEEQRREHLIDAGMANTEAHDIDLALRDDNLTESFRLPLNNDTGGYHLDLSKFT